MSAPEIRDETILPSAIAASSGEPIAPGQALYIEVLGEPEFSRSCRVDEQGCIALPYLGSVHVASRRTADVEADLHDRLEKYLREPVTHVVPAAALEAASGSASGKPQTLVLGEVAHPGAHAWEPLMTVSGRIALAGWFSDQSEARLVWVIRPRLDRRRASVIVCDFHSLMVDGDLAQDVTLKVDDIIYVPRHGAYENLDRADWTAALKYLAGSMTTDELIARLRPTSKDEPVR